MLGSGWVRRGLIGLATMAIFGALPAGAEEIRDWPCEQPLAQRFVAEDVWGAALPRALPEDWRQQAGAQEVVDFAAAPENPPAEGRARIEAFAQRQGADRQEALLSVYAGLLERFDILRSFLIEGVRDLIVRAKIVQGAVDENEAALAALPTNGGAEVEQQRKGYRVARAADARTLDDALEEAEFLCRRYGYLDDKLRQLTAAIRAAL